MSRTKLSKKQTEVWRLLERPDITEVFAGGGAGGGKSWLGCIRQIYRRTTYAGTRGFIGRRDFTALLDSTMKSYFTILQDMGYRAGIEYKYNAQQHSLVFSNGSEQHFRHMAYQPSDPDYNRFGSTEYTDAFIDEAPEVDERAAQIMLSRLRYLHGRHNITPEILYTGNPGDHWIKREFISGFGGVPTILPPHRAKVLFTIHDNPDAQLRESYIKTLGLLSEYDRRRLLHGDWDVEPAANNPFLHAFDPDRHVQPTTQRSDRQLYISIDFNIDPMCAIFAHVWVDGVQLNIHIFGEMSVTGATVQKVCDQIRARYSNNLHTSILTGDGTELKRRIGFDSNASLFDQMRAHLRLGPTQLQVGAPPAHEVSRDECNYILHNANVSIDPSLVGLIADCRSVECDREGKIIKGNRKYDAQRADLLDVFRYLCRVKVAQDWVKLRRKFNL